MCPIYKEIDAILGTCTASTPATVLMSAANGIIVEQSAHDLLPGSPQTTLLGADVESADVNSSANSTTTSPTTRPTNTSAPTANSTTTTTSSAASSICTASSAMLVLVYSHP